MINIQIFSGYLGTYLFLFGLLFPAHNYAAQVTREIPSTTNASRMATGTGSLIGDLEPPLGASHILPGQKFYSVIRDSTRINRSIKKVVPASVMKSQSNSKQTEDSLADDRAISFSSGSITPSAGVDSQMASEIPVLRAKKRNFVYGFILLDEHLSQQTQHAIEALGVALLGPHGKYLHKARFPLDAALIEQVARLPYVEWVGYSAPDQKLDSDLKQMITARPSPAGEDWQSIVINLFEDDVDGGFKRQLETTGATLRSYDPELRAYYAIASPAAIEEIIRLDFVLFVEPVRKTRANHDQSMPAISVDYIRPGGRGTRFDGASTTLGIMDSGFMMGDAAPVMHLDLNKWGCGANFTADAADVWNDQHGHGTHVLGTLVGTGTANNRYRGVAPGIGEAPENPIWAAKVFSADGTGPTDALENAMDFMSDFSCGSERPQVINYSGSATGTKLTGTDSTSRKLDTKVWDFRQLYVVAADNSGPRRDTVGSPGVAKNALTVGNVFDFGFQTLGDISTSSSRGPTGDGRMKPNVVAPGNVITSLKAGTTDQYKDDGGTSMASPHVAGLAATLMEHYPEFRWQPSLLRAHLMATAMAHDNITLPSDNSSGGRNDYGLGRVSAYVAHWDQDTPNGWFSRRASGTVNSTTWLQYDLDVPIGTERLVVVATWDEPAASAGAKRAVTYDLDLWIDIDADCTPDVIGQCGEFASQSFVDNVEYLIIDNPRAGSYRLKVIPWDAPTFDLPVGLTALIIRGSPAPNMTLAATPTTRNPRVGGTFTVTTSVSNPSYVASGVWLAIVPSVPSGLTLQRVQTTRADGVTMDFNRASFSLGDIIESDTRSAVWTFRADTAGIKTIPFRAWSENGGTRTATVTLTVDGVNLTASPTTIPAGGTLTAAWSGIAAPTSKDWIGLFVPSAGNTFIDWIYVSCSKTPGSPRASGSCPFTVPSSVASGNYELRLLANDGFTRLATSNTFTVTSGQTFASGQARSR